ncbi:uncharacterized protein LOC106466891 [Limulus polyphemus]|uniref:Uncharacterized protein LOC106466891 n=1 Tax=Limulus polyphemus TaxID=6850 RepID=A0ABM1T463_LIMPO|nr:uncharacterized protein LOC106466891 [Limulus polyphemus]
MTEEENEERFSLEQLKSALAPLASLEDLASDELESPLSSKTKENYSDFDSEDNLNQLPECIDICKTITARPDLRSVPCIPSSSGLVTPEFDRHFESDVDSQGTLTPCEEAKSQTPSSIRTGSFSSLPKTEKLEQVGDRRKNLSADSILSGYDDKNSSEKIYKSSWTDVFRSRIRSQSHSPQGSPKAHCSLLSSSTDEKNSKRKEKGVFFSIFRFRSRKPSRSKKSSPIFPHSQSPPPVVCVGNMDTQISIPKAVYLKSEPEEISTAETVFISQDIEKSKNEKKNINLNEFKTDVCNGFESELKEQEIESKEKTENLGKELALEYKFVNTLMPTNVEPRTNSIQGLENIDLLTELEQQVSITEVHISSESEIDYDNVNKHHLKRRESEEDYEAETLLTQESLDDDDLTSSDFQIPVSLVKSELSKLPTRQQRLEVSTIPVERPRSTTPLSIAPLEAFIQSASPDVHVEKIHLSLPGEEFSFKLKSTKNVTHTNWVDFCEKGLQSPRTLKKLHKDSKLKGKGENISTQKYLYNVISQKPDSFSIQKADCELTMRTVLYDAEKNTSASEDAWMASEPQMGNNIQRKFSDAAFSDVENLENIESASSESKTIRCDDSSIQFYAGENDTTSRCEKNMQLKTSLFCPCDCSSCGCDHNHIFGYLRHSPSSTTETEAATSGYTSDSLVSVKTCPCECHFGDERLFSSERSFLSEVNNIGLSSSEVQEHLAIKEGSEFQF